MVIYKSGDKVIIHKIIHGTEQIDESYTNKIGLSGTVLKVISDDAFPYVIMFDGIRRSFREGELRPFSTKYL